MNKRILVVTRNLPPLIGGMERFNWHIADELSKDHDVSIISHTEAKTTAPQDTTFYGVPLNPLPIFLILAFFQTFWLCIIQRPDILFAGSGLTAPIAVFWAKIFRKKSIVYIHGLDIGTDNKFYNSLWIPCIRNATQVIANSSPTYDICLRKGIKKDGTNPLLQYAYGSYGHSMDAHFSSTRLSLLDRGFVYAIAHIRGGEDLGRKWYEDGKLLKKKNTFTDFIDCSKYLIKEKYTSPEHLYAEGGSAGGLLMGVVLNMAPELYHGVIAQVPFVDVATTMLDDTIPLTTGEYDEWGNPNMKKYYRYMKSYSPYDNVKAQDYPNMYVSTGLHDSQVQYWEPAKWVAKLRTLKTDTNLLFLDTNMDAGHGGASGRFEALKELAKEFSFLLDLEEIKK